MGWNLMRISDIFLRNCRRRRRLIPSKRCCLAISIKRWSRSA